MSHFALPNPKPQVVTKFFHRLAFWKEFKGTYHFKSRNPLENQIYIFEGTTLLNSRKISSGTLEQAVKELGLVEDRDYSKLPQLDVILLLVKKYQAEIRELLHREREELAGDSDDFDSDIGFGGGKGFRGPTLIVDLSEESGKISASQRAVDAEEASIGANDSAAGEIASLSILPEGSTPGLLQRSKKYKRKVAKLIREAQSAGVPDDELVSHVLKQWNSSKAKKARGETTSR